MPVMPRGREQGFSTPLVPHILGQIIGLDQKNKFPLTADYIRQSANPN